MIGQHLIGQQHLMLTNHKLVVAWQLLEAVCPVLLMRGGIPRKGLTAQWLQQFVSLYRGKLPFPLSYSSIPAGLNSIILPSVAPFVGPIGTTSCCALQGPDGVLSPLWWTSKHLHSCMENTGWSRRQFVPFLSIFHPAHFPLFPNETAI